MFSQQLVHREGGTTTILESTVEDCLKKTRKISERMKGSLLGVTIPYTVEKVQHGLFNVYDVTLPNEFKTDLGEEFVKAYLKAE